MLSGRPGPPEPSPAGRSSPAPQRDGALRVGVRRAGRGACPAGLAGAVPIRPGRFLLYGAAGAFLWAGAWIPLGYVCSEMIGLIASRVAGLGMPIAIGGAAVLIAYAVFKYVRRRRFLRHL